MRTYLYKMTSDRGGAPCAPPPLPGERPMLTLAVCKPAIRRTAEPGDRLLGITSHALARTDGYPLGSVIYAAVVAEKKNGLDYFDPVFKHRPDCIYEFHRLNGEASLRGLHNGSSPLHREPRHVLKDLGHYPIYKNAHVLACGDFRYFGAEALRIPARLHLLHQVADALGQGHRVYEEDAPEAKELDLLFRHLWKRPTRFTAEVAAADSYERRGCR